MFLIYGDDDVAGDDVDVDVADDEDDDDDSVLLDTYVGHLYKLYIYI